MRRRDYGRVLSACIFTAVFLSGFFLSQYVNSDSEQLAFEAGQQSVDLRQVMLSDTDFTNKACRLWWFGMTTQERLLDIPPKPRRKK